jgi:DNA polymerase III epsilon subunit-like protein
MRLVAAAQADPAEAVPVRIPALELVGGQREPRTLGIDIENEPDWYAGGDYIYDRIVCISWKWKGEPGVETAFIDWRHTDAEIVTQLHPLWHALHQAEAFLGHNFRHDWKGLQTLFRELHQPPLERKPIVDTMRCIPSGIPRSLEALCARFDLGEKPHLTNRDWTDALKRYVPEKIELVKHRNREDVILTERLYWKERELGWI